MTPRSSARWSSALVHTALIVGAILTVTPLLWMLSASFMPTGQAQQFPPPLLPRGATLEHYRLLFTRLNLARAAFNSAFIAIVVTTVSVAINSMAGYAFAKLQFRGRDRLFQLLIGALVIPAQVAMLPLFLQLKQMGLVNTYLGAMIPTFASIFGIFLIRQYALGIPDALLDAARMDGASEVRIYRIIVLPVIRPILVTLGIFTFMNSWNDFMWPLIVLTDDSLYTLPVALANLSGEHVQDTELMMAGSVLTVLPVLILFLVLQRFYVAGIVAGSVKE
jgi:multiple sugar transport system permease protein